MSKMLKSGPILILSHWNTGSRFIAKMLAACGMEVGNDETFWDENCEIEGEHGLLNRIGNEIILGNIDNPRWPALVEETLERYSEQAKKLKWKHFGVKAKNCLHDPGFTQIFEPAFKRIWPKARIVLVVRHPADIVAATNDENWPENKILESIRATYDATEYLLEQGALLVKFPDEIQVFWKKVVPALGMKATQKISNQFKDQIEIIDTKHRAAFAEAHADDVTWFEGLGK